MKKLYIVEHYHKDKQEWLKHRGFGGSSVSALFGKNKYKNALDIYCAAMNPTEEKQDKQTASTIYGSKAERPVAELFALHHPEYKLIYPKGITMYRRKDKPFMTYTADAILVELETGRKGIYEGKTRLVQSRADAEEWRNGNPPEQYVLQVLQGLAVLNDFDFVELNVELIFINYDTGKYSHSEIFSKRLERENVKEAIETIEQVETEFEENNIQQQIPPDLKIEIEYEEEE